MKKKVLGIKWKMFGYLLTFSMILLIILILFQTVFLNDFYVMVKQRFVNNQITKISSYVKNTDWESINTSTLSPDELFVEVWTTNCKFKMSSGAFVSDIHNQLMPNEIDELMDYFEEGKTTYTKKNYASDGKGDRGRESLLSAQLVNANDGETYIVIVSAGLSPIDSVISTIRVQLVVISIIMILFSVVLALIISRNISKPIVKLSEEAKKLGEGKYNQEFQGSGYKEVVQLADTLSEASIELEKTEELRRELIANVSHDLRTPLTLITGYSEMMRDMPSEATAENMQVIIDESRRLTDLVQDLLDMSKLQSGTYKMKNESFDLNELTEEIVGRVSRFCEQDGYTIQYESNREVMILADSNRISQVIYNFLLNAILHTGDDKRVYANITHYSGRVRLSVTDTGKGIAADDIPRIWERYYKVQKDFARTNSGTGLGLSIVKSILDNMKGVTYGVNSEIGKGSTFWFEIEGENANENKETT
ncbi:MAG: sensor histidine kinase [Suipraeoptans sp.]